MAMIYKLARFCKTIWSLAFFSPEEKRIIEAGKSTFHLPEGGEKVLVQMIDDPAFLLKFFFILKTICESKKQHVQVRWIWVPIPYRFNKKAFRSYLIELFLKNPLAKRKWSRFYHALGGETAIDNGDKNFSREVVETADREWSRLTKNEDIFSISYHGTEVGDLVHDTYLRYANKPTVNIRDPFLKEVIACALHLVEMYQALFAREKYRFLLTSYTSYIHHGIPARVALQNGITVYGMGAGNQLITDIKTDFPYHTRNFHNYKKWFEEFSPEQQKEALATGHGWLQKRLGGKIDPALWYMQNSPYAVDPAFDLKNILPPKTKKTVLIMGHDFFDSPHGYGHMIYPDFFIWMSKTLELLKDLPYEILIKPHPNGVRGSHEIFAEFGRRYPFVTMLPPKVSNLQLAQRGVDALVTVHGTVAHEMAYLGIPVICAADNPHMEFSFCLTVTEEEKYLSLLRDLSQLPKQTPQSDEIAAFYFVHNYRSLGGRMALFPVVVTLKTVSEFLDPKEKDFQLRMATCQEEFERLYKI